MFYTIIYVWMLGQIFAFGDMMRSNKLSKSCTGANYATSGTQSSTNFGVSYGSCSGFSCSGGYTVSGSSCVVAAVPNIVCDTQTDGTSNMHCFYHSNANNMSFGSTFVVGWDLMGCSNSPNLYVNRKYYCPSVPSRFAGVYYQGGCGGPNIFGMYSLNDSDFSHCTRVY